MRILFTVCGRAGSKGIKNKNIRAFLGRPLPWYTFAAIDLYIKQHPEKDFSICINTDSQELMDLAENYPELDIVLLPREEMLSGDNVAKIDVIRDCYIRMKSGTSDYDVVVDLDITSPLRSIKDIENLINTYANEDRDIVYSVCPARRNPYFNMVQKTDSGYKKIIESNYVTRQQAPEMFDMNASLYAYSPKYLLSEKHFDEGNQGIILMEDTGVLDLDREDDFELMEEIAEYFYKKKSGFNEIKKRVDELHALGRLR